MNKTFIDLIIWYELKKAWQILAELLFRKDYKMILRFTFIYQKLEQQYYSGSEKADKTLDYLETSNTIWDTRVHLYQMPVPHIYLLWFNSRILFLW